MPKEEDKIKPQMKLEVQSDEVTAQGIYSNLAGIAHSETEFIMDFLFLYPNQSKAKLKSRIIATPVHAKRFLAALGENIRKYEERFGPIEEKSAPPYAHG